MTAEQHFSVFLACLLVCSAGAYTVSLSQCFPLVVAVVVVQVQQPEVLSNSTSNHTPSTAVINEQIGIEFTFHNPLAIPLRITKVRAFHTTVSSISTHTHTQARSHTCVTLVTYPCSLNWTVNSHQEMAARVQTTNWTSQKWWRLRSTPEAPSMFC